MISKDIVFVIDSSNMCEFESSFPRPWLSQPFLVTKSMNFSKFLVLDIQRVVAFQTEDVFYLTHLIHVLFIRHFHKLRIQA